MAADEEGACMNWDVGGGCMATEEGTAFGNWYGGAMDAASPGLGACCAGLDSETGGARV